jgi:hypothetical protein
MRQLCIIINRCLGREKEGISRIDAILFQLHILGRFLDLVKKLAEPSPAFNVQLSRGGPIVYIDFPKLFGLHRRFAIDFRFGELMISSVGVVYIPPETTTRLLFLPYTSSSDTAECILAFLRDVVWYTRYMNVWLSIARVARLLPFRKLDVRMHPDPKYLTLGQIISQVPVTELYRISLSGLTGRLWVRYVNDLHEEVDNRDDRQIANTLLIGFTAVIKVIGVLQLRYRVPPFSNLVLNYIVEFSMAPDFRVLFQINRGHPRIVLLDSQGNCFPQPETVRLESLTDQKAWTVLCPVLEATRRTAFLAQTQKTLSEAKIDAMLFGNVLELRVPSCRLCILKCDEKGWRITFMMWPSFCGDAIYKIGSQTYSARVARIVAALVVGFHTWAWAEMHLKRVSGQFPVIQRMSKNKITEILMQVAGRGLLISYIGDFKFNGKVRNVVYMEPPNVMGPILEFRFAASLWLSSHTRGFVRGEFSSIELLSFFSHSALPLVRMVDVFGGSRWAVAAMGIKHGFSVVFDRRYTLTLMLKPYMCFTFAVPESYPSCLLFGPLTAVAGRRSDAPVKRMMISIQNEMLENVRALIEAFGEMIAVIENNGFRYDSASAKIPATFVQKINGVPVYIVIMGVDTGFQVDCGTEIGEKVKLLMEGVSSDFVFVSRFTDLIKVTLTVDLKLFDVVLEVLTRLKARGDYDAKTLAGIMATAMINDNGNGLLQICDGSGWFSVEIVAPFSVGGVLMMTREGQETQDLNGVEELFLRMVA